MQIAVKHNLQLYEPDNIENPGDPGIILPIADAQAVMGETIAAYLARVAWRFELPTVLTINGEFYGRAEWETRAVAANDHVEFISRPLGGGRGGSVGKSILSVVALVALTAAAGPAGPLGAALATSLGSFGGAVASAAIVGAGALAISHFLAPKAGGKTSSTDALHSFGLQGNAARPMQPIPVLNGRLKFAPDYAAPNYSDSIGDTLTDHGDGFDGPSRLRARERSTRAHRWLAPWPRGAGVRHGAEGAHPWAPPGRGLRSWAKRAARVLRGSGALALRLVRRGGQQHA
ncbi:hypothetical protein [Methylobacterium sp. B4]|uniref:hypothetical protein n=1 Tax=Methylobacterium sp. B4 TaxID=1938755 RepID=UPI0015E8B36F|nr:hypothetical protein [Methylobacterium sp. B4]